MENPIPNVTKGQKKQKSKVSVKAVQNPQSNPQAVCGTAAQAQGQQAQQCKPQAA